MKSAKIDLNPDVPGRVRRLRWLSGALLSLILLFAGCTTPPPTLSPPGYSYLDVPPNSAADSSQVRLTRVIWGPYLLRFLGTTALGDHVPLQALLYKNDQLVEWWPEHQNVQVHDGTWEIAINANDYHVPEEIPQPGAGYSLEIFEPNYVMISTRYDLPFPGPPGEEVPADNVTGAALDGTAWSLTSINGHSPVLFSHITLYFSGGSARGSAGCNSYGSQYETKSPDLIGFSAPISTQVGCRWKAITNQEHDYLTALSDVAAYRLVDNRLELYDVMTNQRSLVFTRAR